MQILVIQTAFIGDVILATSLLEAIHQQYPEAELDLLVRKGNEGLLEGHPFLRKVWVWEKQKGKYQSLRQIIRKVRKERYNYVLNLQRFTSSGLITALSGSKVKAGFAKNPLSFSFQHRFRHVITPTHEATTHETERNLAMLKALPEATLPTSPPRPCLYPPSKAHQQAAHYQHEPYVCIAPTSVWFTKQFPPERWSALLRVLPFEGKVYLLGAPADHAACEHIISGTQGKVRAQNLCGALNLLASAALMEKAVLNFVNDSAPLHLASAMNAPVCAIFCSTVPAFGFGPMSDFAEVVQVPDEHLNCRPCGLHGYQECPQGHFRCAYDIEQQDILRVFERAKARWQARGGSNGVMEEKG